MKKLWMLVVAICMAVSTMTVAQDMGKDSDMGKGKMSMDKSTMSPVPLKTLEGTVKSEGDKIVFINDADQKSWDVINPETLKDHVGHHVKLSAHVKADTDQIHVMKVRMMKDKMMKDSKSSGM